MKQLKSTILFLFINLGGLALGSWVMNNGPLTEWYINLNKAPWTPPGWVFGVAWSVIMICFSFFLTKLFSVKNTLVTRIIFLTQFIFNIGWNYVFFNQHLVLLGLISIVFLTSIIFYYFFTLGKFVGNFKYLLIPYMVWLCIATSLNLYILIHN